MTIIKLGLREWIPLFSADSSLSLSIPLSFSHLLLSSVWIVEEQRTPVSIGGTYVRLEGPFAIFQPGKVAEIVVARRRKVVHQQAFVHLACTIDAPQHAQQSLRVSNWEWENWLSWRRETRRAEHKKTETESHESIPCALPAGRFMIPKHTPYPRIKLSRRVGKTEPQECWWARNCTQPSV